MQCLGNITLTKPSNRLTLSSQNNKTKEFLLFDEDS